MIGAVCPRATGLWNAFCRVAKSSMTKIAPLILGDVRAANEADRVDVGMGQDRVDRFLVAMHHLEHALGQAGLHEQFGQAHRY